MSSITKKEEIERIKASAEGTDARSHAILTELRIKGDSALVAISVGKNNDIDFNAFRSACKHNKVD